MSNGHASQALRTDVARVADDFHVPSEGRKHFCDLLCETLEGGRRRARHAEPGPALVKAANAVRALDEALASLNNEDRKAVEGLLAEHPGYSDAEAADVVASLRETVSWLVGLFSIAIGKSAG